MCFVHDFLIPLVFTFVVVFMLVKKSIGRNILKCCSPLNVIRVSLFIEIYKKIKMVSTDRVILVLITCPIFLLSVH